MITLTMLREDGRIQGFTCSGHANQGDYGNDLVCSAVSAITQTCVIGIAEVLKLDAAIAVSETGGIDCRLPKGLGETERQQAELLMRTMLAGLQSVQASYPGTLKTIDREV
jgi:hypothetical protein